MTLKCQNLFVLRNRVDGESQIVAGFGSVKDARDEVAGAKEVRVQFRLPLWDTEAIVLTILRGQRY